MSGDTMLALFATASKANTGSAIAEPVLLASDIVNGIAVKKPNKSRPAKNTGRPALSGSGSRSTSGPGAGTASGMASGTTSGTASGRELVNRLQRAVKQLPSAHEWARVEESKDNWNAAIDKSKLEMKLIPPLPPVKMENQKDPFGPEIKAPLIHLAR